MLVDGDDHLMGVNGENEASSTDQFKALQFRLNWRWCRLQLIGEGPMESEPNHLGQEKDRNSGIYRRNHGISIARRFLATLENSPL
jgi:hypothetical protein